uniref:Uncharacterized protein n=1 Tax=Strigamia maritima TaxID=126957 RepID=T1JF75_STRMM
MSNQSVLKPNLTATGRDYNNNNNAGMAFPNLETSLTTLAFISFGAFLLSMIMQAMNVTGRRRRDTDFCTENCEGNIYDLSEATRLALKALNFAIFDRDLADCEARALCNTFSKTRQMGGIVTLAPFITRLSLKFLHERKSHIFTSDKWEILKKITSSDECEVNFIDCVDNSDKLINRKSDNDADKKLMLIGNWQFKRKKLRPWQIGKE